jgi:lipopolysaccharide/colanic/teichoic acid biosynthesis glycosyltransferase
MRAPSIPSDQATSAHIGTQTGYELERASSLITLRACREPLLKRPLDIILSSVMLLLSAPIWLIIALAIKLEDGGPTFYSQRRWGWCGTIITVLKFRTMTSGAHERDGPKQATQGDQRITHVGKFLRACGLDELPQLLNIWKGEMSFVGPRALAVGELVNNGHDDYTTYGHIRGFAERLIARPGLTSVATIFLPKDAHPYRKFRYDLLYIRRLSFWFDLQLIALSFWISFRGKWEARGRKV